MEIVIYDDGTTIVWSDCICSVEGSNPYCTECYPELLELSNEWVCERSGRSDGACCDGH